MTDISDSISALSVLQAAQQFVRGQHLPDSTLYVVATPIGNLADISLRALAVLSVCDVVAAEDTRVTRNLLQVYGISPLYIMRSDAYTEHSICEEMLKHLAAKKRVALLSDAGTPGVSDPGAAVVAAVRAAGFAVVPLPGASSVVSLLSAAGIEDTAFSFVGFAPTQAKAREAFCQQLAQCGHTQIFFEAPHRAMALLQALAAALAPMQRVVIGRELTKRYEAIHSLTAGELPAWLKADHKLDVGELVIAIGKAPAAAPQDGSNTQQLKLLATLMKHLPLKTAVNVASEITGTAKNALYEQALKLKANVGEDEGEKDIEA
jgi:16S rRNA (cytidine1402-2'-O)-methyltransferase